MLGYLRTRLLAAVPVVFGVSILVFLMLRFVPGDPARALLGDAPADEATLERVREQLGLNEPLPIQYGRFVVNAVHGDLGRSARSQRPVADEILGQLPSTVQLTLAAMCLAGLLGIALGVVAAIRHNSWVDHTTMVVALVGLSTPSFWLSLLFVLVLSVMLGWLPPSGSEGIDRLVMPATVLGISAAGIIARLTRSSMLEELQLEYVTVARAKGLRERTVIYRHALRNALIPVVTIVGLQVGNLLAGAVVVETVFARRGIGRLLIDSMLAKDFAVVQGLMLFIAASYVMVNLLVDLLYAAVDPRIHYR